jgi:hypothetical protein
MTTYSLVDYFQNFLGNSEKRKRYSRSQSVTSQKTNVNAVITSNVTRFTIYIFKEMYRKRSICHVFYNAACFTFLCSTKQ